MLIYLESVVTTYLAFEGDQTWCVGSFLFPIYTMNKRTSSTNKRMVVDHHRAQAHLQWRSNLEAIRFTWITNTSKESKQKHD